MLNNQTNPNDNISVSYLQTVTQTTTISKPLSFIVEQIRTGQGELKKHIEMIRATEHDKIRQDLKKKHLPAFSFSIFRDGQRNNANFLSASHLIYDVDHIEQSQLATLKATLKQDTSVFCFFVSPSGDGIKIVLKLAEAITTSDQYCQLYEYYADLYSTRYNITLDPSTKDPARLCYVSYDPDLYLNHDAEPVPTTIKQDVAPSQVKAIDPPPKRKELLNALRGSSEGGRTHAATQLIGMYIKQGSDREMTLELLKVWNRGNNTPPLDDDKLSYTVRDLFDRYEKTMSSLPCQFISKNGGYYKKGKESQMITTFTIEPKELLTLDDSDALVCDVTSLQGISYKDLLVENTDWHSKTRFLKALGHQDCSFLGSETDLQALCSFVNSRIPVRKQGTKVVGLYDNTTWVAGGKNITTAGDASDPKIIPVAKGKDAFHREISYGDLSDAEYKAFISTFYENVERINVPEVVYPWLGWIYASPIKPVVMDHIGGFPLLFVHGGQGSGKTHTSKLFKRLLGYRTDEPVSCTQRSFPMLKLLSATNAIPVFLDEFKESDMKEEEIDNLLRYMRRVYSGEVESKGRPDQTIEDYHLQAPMCVMGEWSIQQPALLERVLLIKMRDTVKKNKSMQIAYKNVMNLPLNAFMPRYIQFVLGLDVKTMLDQATEVVTKQFDGVIVAPRVMNNLAVMVLGLELFKLYAERNGVKIPNPDISGLLKSELKTITGTDSGMVRTAVDQMIEELAVMAQLGKLPPTDFRKVEVDDRMMIAFQFKKAFRLFKVHANQTKYEGDQLDERSYFSLFDDTGYIHQKSHPVKIEGSLTRCLCIDVLKAKQAGLDLAGFGIE